MPSITKKLTFGLELEIVKLSPTARELIARHRFGSHYDRTIRGRNGEALPGSVEDGGGTELVTQPVSVDVTCAADGSGMSIDYGQSAAVVRDLCACAAEVNVSCGLHVHLGRPDTAGKSRWEPERVRTMLLIGMALEKKLFDLCPASRLNNQYCKAISASYAMTDLRQFYPMGEVRPRKYDNPKRYCWMNIIETRRNGDDAEGRAAGPGLGTIEIRMLGNARRFDYVWAWVRLWLQIGAYVAYVPSSLAVGHCVYSGSLDAAFRDLAEAKNVDRKKPEKTQRGAIPTAPQRLDPVDDDDVAADRRLSEAGNWVSENRAYVINTSDNTTA